MRRNGVIGEFNKLHWVWKFLLITGSFGVVHAVVRRAKGNARSGFLPGRDVPAGLPPSAQLIVCQDHLGHELCVYEYQELRAPGVGGTFTAYKGTIDGGGAVDFMTGSPESALRHLQRIVETTAP